jgi:uncharacterized membrane protein
MLSNEIRHRDIQGPLPFGRGWEWTKQGFRFFAVSPLAWILCTIIMMTALMVLSFLPLVSILVYLVSPVFYGGLMVGCRTIESGSPLEVRHLFAGFHDKTTELISIGGLQLIGMLAIALVVGGIGYATMDRAGFDIVATGLSPAVLILTLIAAAMTLPLAMAVWFAPAIVMLDGTSALEAMKMSFRACMLNLLALTSYSLILLLLMLFAAMTFGLGFLVVIPVVVASIYAAYGDIFQAHAANEADPLRN